MIRSYRRQTRPSKNIRPRPSDKALEHTGGEVIGPDCCQLAVQEALRVAFCRATCDCRTQQGPQRSPTLDANQTRFDRRINKSWFSSDALTVVQLDRCTAQPIGYTLEGKVCRDSHMHNVMHTSAACALPHAVNKLRRALANDTGTSMGRSSSMHCTAPVEILCVTHVHVGREVFCLPISRMLL